MAAVVGRGQELSVVERFLDDAQAGAAALVLEGEAGIGKTTVWRETLRLAEARGFRTLVCRPAEAEAKMGFAALADLLASVESEAFAELPEPQRHALDVALLRTPPDAAGSNPRGVAAGLLAVLSRFAETSPVLVAIDDVQWLDRASATSLSFALRRLDPARPVAVAVAVRLEPGSPADALGLVQRADGRATRIRLNPLTFSALYHVIRAELGLVFPRPILQRIDEASGGNPLFAIELARALDEAGGRPAPGDPLPVPNELVELLEGRVARLTARSREALLGAVLLSVPTVSLVERALGESAQQGLQRARRAGLIDVRQDRIRFGHPLVGAAVLSSAPPSARRSMHRRLAAVIENEEERARHLALSAVGPDGAIAASLEQAAHLAERRGAPEHAAELVELAWRLTPPRDAAALDRRRLDLARVVWRAGDSVEAVRILDGILEEPPAGRVRARALELRAQTHWVDGTSRDAEACCTEALALAGDDDELRARILVTLARVTIDAELLHRRAREALDVLESLDRPDPALVSEALVALVGAEVALTGRIPTALVERGLALEREAPPVNVADRMSAALGTWLKYTGDFDGARHWLETTYQAALDEGDEGSLPYALSHLPQLELWVGNWSRAEARALEHLELAERTGQSLERLTAIYNLCHVQAHLGRIQEAHAQLMDALAEAERGDPWNVYQLLSVLGFLELSRERGAEAVASLRRALEIYEASGAGDLVSTYENHAEALVLIGDLETAARFIDAYEARARAANRAMALAPALRCRALLEAATGDLDGAVAALEEAIAQHELVRMPFSLARTLLVLGHVRRRRGERRSARDALERALGMFDELGAALWAERARAALRRVPIRRSVATEHLTPTEERVAELVAHGHTNREVAQALFMSEKTVEANLTRIYQKLGIRSRSALAALRAVHDSGGVPPGP